MKQSGFQLVKQRIKETEFKLNKETDIKSGECENYKISAGVQVGINEEIPNEALVTLTFQIGEIEEQQVKSDNNFYLKVVIDGIFNWTDEVTDEEQDRLLKQNAPAILLSYIRSYVALTTVSAGLESFIIPVFNFAK